GGGRRRCGAGGVGGGADMAGGGGGVGERGGGCRGGGVAVGGGGGGGGVGVPANLPRVLDRWAATGRCADATAEKAVPFPRCPSILSFAALNPFYGDRSRIRWGGDWRDPPQAWVREMG